MKKAVFYLGIILVTTVVMLASGNFLHAKPPVSSTQIAVDETALKYTGNDFDEEVDAEGREILISGNNNRLTIKGKTPKILITGKDNDIAVENVQEITITGSGNFVSWEKSEHSSGKPIIQDKGGYNNVGKKSGNALNKSEN